MVTDNELLKILDLAETKSVEEFRVLVNSARLNDRPKENGGRSAIELAVAMSSLKAVTTLLEAGANNKANLLRIAARNNRVDLIPVLLKAGADVNDGSLHVAAYSGHLEFVEALLKEKTDVNARIGSWVTWYDRLDDGRRESVEILAILIKSDFFKTLKFYNNDDDSIFLFKFKKCMASERCNVLLPLMIEQSADFPHQVQVGMLNLMSKLDPTQAPMSHFLENVDNLKLKYFGYDLLHGAVEVGNTKLIISLLKLGVDPNIKNLCAQTPLMLIVWNRRSLSPIVQLDIIHILLNAGAKIDARDVLDKTIFDFILAANPISYIQTLVSMFFMPGTKDNIDLNTRVILSEHIKEIKDDAIAKEFVKAEGFYESIQAIIHQDHLQFIANIVEMEYLKIKKDDQLLIQDRPELEKLIQKHVDKACEALFIGYKQDLESAQKILNIPLKQVEERIKNLMVMKINRKHLAERVPEIFWEPYVNYFYDNLPKIAHTSMENMVRDYAGVGSPSAGAGFSDDSPFTTGQAERLAIDLGVQRFEWIKNYLEAQYNKSQNTSNTTVQTAASSVTGTLESKRNQETKRVTERNTLEGQNYNSAPSDPDKGDIKRKLDDNNLPKKVFKPINFKEFQRNMGYSSPSVDFYHNFNASMGITSEQSELKRAKEFIHTDLHVEYLLRSFHREINLACNRIREYDEEVNTLDNQRLLILSHKFKSPQIGKPERTIPFSSRLVEPEKELAQLLQHPKVLAGESIAILRNILKQVTTVESSVEMAKQQTFNQGLKEINDHIASIKDKVAKINQLLTMSKQYVDQLNGKALAVTQANETGIRYTAISHSKSKVEAELKKALVALENAKNIKEMVKARSEVEQAVKRADEIFENAKDDQYFGNHACSAGNRIVEAFNSGGLAAAN